MTDTETDAGPTEGPWVADLEKTPLFVCSESDDFRKRRVICHVSETTYDEGMPAEANARLIAAAGRAAHELPDEHDPVETLGILSELVQHAEDLMPLLEIQSSIDHTTLQDLLQKARRDDASE